ncbi:MAG: pyridoxal phosphate-dependent aminotransferase [Gammaproteobacteria bacterium]|nr:pyridoxal phosphate-dependent aminotransferase [Gammaproteobacteria bacterium]
MSEITLSQRVQAIKPSPTLAVTGRARELRAAGHDVIGLGAGEPDFDTPQHIKEAGIKAIKAGATKYTAVDGTPELKNAIIDKFKRENALEYAPEQVLVSAGAKHSLFNLFQALLNPGDEVVIPAPYWVSYPDLAIMAEAKPVIITTDFEHSFKVTPEQLDRAITPRARLVILNSPSNPTGCHYTPAELEALGGVLAGHPDLVVATDDIYEHILWTDEPFRNIVNMRPELKERTVVVNGVSKAYAMTGWRIGYAAGDARLIGAMKKIQSQSTSNPCSISQAAAVAALAGDQACIAPMCQAFKQRHDAVVSRLNATKGVRALPSDGTFYTFPDFSEAIAATPGAEDDTAMAGLILERAGVALVPGSAFGGPGHMRLSYATDMDTLNDALDRLQNMLGAK